eukprot:6177022-Pleurochrysis_carterae.AAC.3
MANHKPQAGPVTNPPHRRVGPMQALLVLLTVSSAAALSLVANGARTLQPPAIQTGRRPSCIQS